MCIKTIISLSDELRVKCLLAHAGLVCCHQQNRFAFGVKGKCYTPFNISRAKTQLFHVRVPGTVERVNAGPSQLRPELLQKLCKSKDLRLYILVQSIKFRLELISNFDDPRHINSML